jgi:hypothetical protein
MNKINAAFRDAITENPVTFLLTVSSIAAGGKLKVIVFGANKNKS